MMYPKNAGPLTHGANEDVPVREEETYQGFERLVNLRGWRGYKQREQRMKELGLLSNPGDIQEIYSEQFRRIGGWWDILKGWIDSINKYIGPLIDLYKELEEAGIITPAQRDKAEAEGWTKEELISLIRAQMAPTWQTYLPWIIAGGVGVGLLAVLLARRSAPIYVTK